jgi:hypothetical protein
MATHVTLRNLTPAERGQSSKKYKKYAAEINDGTIVYFGHNQYDDYTIHKDEERMQRYINRHQRRENWTLSGIETPGFWSRWLLWNKPSFRSSLKDLEKRFSVVVYNTTNRKD